MLKPDEQVVNEAIANDPVIQQIDADIVAAKDKEKARVDGLYAKISEEWKAVRDLKRQMGELKKKLNIRNMVIRGMHKRTKHNQKPINKLMVKRRARIRVITNREEKKFLEAQRAEFRKGLGLKG